jgi:hypothetical protein
MPINGPANGFHFPLDLDVIGADGKTERLTIDLDAKVTTKHVSHAVTSVIYDPEESVVGVVACGEPTDAPCKPGFTCAADYTEHMACFPD